MAQEFTIKSKDIEDKINQLLPSQGGFQPGVDFSASTMVIPIVDLTETAEGSNVREDLQTALTFSNVTYQLANLQVATPITTTGYWSLIMNSTITGDNANVLQNFVSVTDGVTDQIIFNHVFPATAGTASITQKTIIKVRAGESIKQTSNNAQGVLAVTYRQIADLAGNLVNP